MLYFFFDTQNSPASGCW